MENEIRPGEIMDRLGPDRQAVWALLEEAEALEEGYHRRGDGGYLKTGTALLYFAGDPFPNLAGFADCGSRRVWADARYRWNVEYARGEGLFPTKLIKLNQPEYGEIACGKSRDVWEVAIRAGAEDVETATTYRLPESGQWLEEEIRVANRSAQPIRVVDWDFGPARGLTCETWPVPVRDLERFRAVAVPWRRQMHDPQCVQDYGLKDLLEKRGGQNAFTPGYHILPLSGLFSEAWALINGGSGLLVTKYAPRHLEYSVLRHEQRECLPDRAGGQDHEVRQEWHEHLVFGGSARCLRDPSPGVLHPGEGYDMGLTRYHFFTGDWEQGFRLFRDTMAGWGHALPEGYETHVHWNELYDNKTEWTSTGEKLEESKARYYRIEDMREEAAKAVEYGCETLYMDPGWDTLFANSVWDEKRLGSLAGFVGMIRRDFGLNVALHTPLAGWCDPGGYPESSYRMDRTGAVHRSVCAGSRQYLETKAERLRALARAGVSFLMFDGSFYTGSCYDSRHGHAVPYTRDDHVRAYRWLAEQVHAVNPELKIEMHDLATIIPDMPVYLNHGNGGWDEMWGWEMMWDPYKDLITGRALTLYDYNLAYSIPVYLHINLRMDNANGLMFWWYASTCRHIGIGGTHENPETRELLRKAMKAYRQMKAYFVNGTFVGLSETAHLHVLKARKGGVLNLFNLEESEHARRVRIAREDLNLSSRTALAPRDVAARWAGEQIEIDVTLPPLSPAVMLLCVNESGRMEISRMA